MNSDKTKYAITLTGTTTPANIALYSMPNISPYPFTQITEDSRVIAPGGGKKTFTYNFLKAGYYLVRLKHRNSEPSSYTLTYSTDQYPCPYEPSYVDVFNDFAGCVPIVPVVNATPCVKYD